MPEVLSGSLEQLPLIDILKMLSSGKRTGRLDLSQIGNSGEIYLKEGSLVHAATANQIAERAVYTMMAWMDGEFSFAAGAEAPEESIELATEQILLEAARKMEEWKDIKQMIPSSEVVFMMSPSGSPETVSLQPTEWQVLAQVNGRRSVEDLARILNKNEYEVAKILYSLTKAGLLEIGEKSPDSQEQMLSKAFFDRLQEEYTDIMGPLGPVIIEDEVQALGAERDKFPKRKGTMLIERLSNEILEEDKRTGFQRTMLEIFKEMAGKE